LAVTSSAYDRILAAADGSQSKLEASMREVADALRSLLNKSTVSVKLSSDSFPKELGV
jgi:hypothetical protein